MGKSSFHISDEFNGKGEKVYLRASQHNVVDPPKKEKVRLTPQFTSVVQKAVGAMPLTNSVNEKNNLLAKAVGAVATVGRIAVTKDEKSDKYVVSFKVSKEQLTTGAYLHKSSVQGKH